MFSLAQRESGTKKDFISSFSCRNQTHPHAHRPKSLPKMAPLCKHRIKTGAQRVVNNRHTPLGPRFVAAFEVSLRRNVLESETHDLLDGDQAAHQGREREERQAPPPHADENSNYVDEVVDMTASITALSFYCTSAL